MKRFVCVMVMVVFVFMSLGGVVHAHSHVSFFAHRGASALAPENTIEAFEQAINMGADYIELDIQMSQDGHLVVIHDDTLDRTTNASGDVSHYTLAQLKKLDAGSWFDVSYEGAKIPTLEDVFQAFGDHVHYCIEIKANQRSEYMIAKLHELIENYQLMDVVMVQSFDEDLLHLLRNIDVTYPLIQIISRPKSGFRGKNQLSHVESYADGLCLNARYTSPSFVKHARTKGLLVHMYTVNKRKDIKKWLNRGVTGIITDDLRLMEYFK
ncbi:glycerophosphodiester phosphodiesterase [Halalkalibacter hemicellulosilyticus]|uniref:Glycerophosphoryl diester phosphodiesterase n=1 Tax=Halalkalibacter hemicellulosilyticusJCM 9152 TaxID=1236971 RepID=W4QJR0_9BACI|nr:glycerophosphodiester phosphodiesterase family protein [Halalkalibacter hemicellulosilyticus]GAE31574.1 glycerophosphoryl diester phosphodiesterase [Halalkalibacter hemicellulosilyticusJCM 9152]